MLVRDNWRLARMKSAQRLELLLPPAAALCLISCTLIASHRMPMWLDELYTYYAISHDSFAAFLRSYRTGINGAPPLYFLATWAVSRVIPLSALSLRLYSSVASGVALFFIWTTLRRYTGFFVSSVATLTPFLTSNLFLEHNSEARFYGLYIALLGWSTYKYDQLCTLRSPSRRQLFSNSVSHGLAVSCTYVAGCYSCAILLALIIRDYSLGLWRPKVYLSVLAGWLPMLFYAPLILSQKDATKWLRVPGLGAIFNPIHLGIEAYFVLFAFAGLVAIALLRQHHSSGSIGAASESHAEKKDFLHLVILAFTFLAVPYGLLIISWAGFPLLHPRYALPSLIGVALLLGFVISGLFSKLPGTAPDREVNATGVAEISDSILRAVLLASLLVYPLGIATVLPSRCSLCNVASQDVQINEMDLATSDWHSYLPLYFQSGENRRIYFVLKTSKQRDLCARFNPRLNPITVDDFLASHERFQILSVDAGMEWLETELIRRGGFRITTEERSEKRKLLTVVAQREIQPHQ